jgi:hypothetical protein
MVNVMDTEMGKDAKKELAILLNNSKLLDTVKYIVASIVLTGFIILVIIFSTVGR